MPSIRCGSLPRTELGNALLDAVQPLVEVGHRMELMAAEAHASEKTR